MGDEPHAVARLSGCTLTRLRVALVRAQDAARTIDDRRVQHPPVERDRTLTASERFVERAHDPSRFLHLRRAGAEDLVDDGDVTGMYQRLAAKTEAARPQAVGAKAGRIVDVRPDAIERELSRRHGGD